MNALLNCLLESGWQSAVVALVVSAILVLSRGRIPANWRYALLFLVVLRMLLPALPESRVSVYRIVPSSPARAWSQAVPSHPAPAWMEPQSFAAPVIPNPASQLWNWPRIIAALWLLGAIAAAAWLASQQFLFQRHFRRVRKNPSPEIQSALAAAADRAKLKHVPAIWAVPGIEGPALYGVLPSVVIVPPYLASTLPPDQLVLVLLHECIHLRRADAWSHLLSVVAWIIHWWNPVAWWLLRRLHAERELATDAAVLACLAPKERRAYGETLLSLAQHSPSGPWQPALALLERHTDLTRRITQISAFTRASVVWSIVGALLLAGLAVILLVRERSPIAHGSSVRDPLPTDTQAQAHLVQNFLDAVRLRDMKKVEDLLNRGLDINCTNGDSTALVWAASNKDLPMARYLLGHGAQVNFKGKGLAPIGIAIRNGDKEIADLFIAAGASYSPVMYAAGTGQVELLEKLNTPKPIAVAELKSAARASVTSNHLATFNWLWTHLAPQLDAKAQGALLDALFKDTANGAGPDIMNRLVELGADFKKNAAETLTWAVIRDNIPLVDYMLSHGVSLSDPGVQKTLVRDVAGEGQLEMVKTLLRHGGNINNQDNQKFTALAWAAYCRQSTVCRYLIEHGADISIKNYIGQTALFQAAFGGNLPDIVDLLLQHGADPRLLDNSGASILCAMQTFAPPRPDKAAWPNGTIYSEKEIQKLNDALRRIVTSLLKAGADPNTGAGFNGSPLITAIMMGNSAISHALIQLGANPNQRDKLGNTPISFVFFGGWAPGVDLETLKQLLDRGADPSATLVQPNCTPIPPPVPILSLALTLATRQQDQADLRRATAQAIALLLQKGAAFSVAADPRGPEWLAAAATGRLARLKELHAVGLDLNTTDAQGWTALSISLALGFVDVSDWLVRQGASLKNTNVSPLYLAVQADNTALIDKILQSGIKPDNATMAAAAYRGNLKLVLQLQQAGGDPSHIQFYQLVQKGYADVLKVVLESGASVKDDWNSEKRNDVYWAVYFNQPECLKLLLDHGVAPNVTDSYGESPLSYAKKFRPAMVPLLEAAIAHEKSSPSPTQGAMEKGSEKGSGRAYVQ